MNMAFFIPISAIVATAWVIVKILHYRAAGRAAAIAGGDGRDNARLVQENETLRLTVERLEKRMAVLEAIATDPAERTAREIEALR
jgi:hypothetical protein